MLDPQLHELTTFNLKQLPLQARLALNKRLIEIKNQPVADAVPNGLVEIMAINLFIYCDGIGYTCTEIDDASTAV